MSNIKTAEKPMNKDNFSNTKYVAHKVKLYRYVFYSRVPLAVVFALLSSFCLQPFENAFADTETPPLYEDATSPETALTEADFIQADQSGDATTSTSLETDLVPDIPDTSSSSDSPISDATTSVSENADTSDSATSSENNTLAETSATSSATSSDVVVETERGNDSEIVFDKNNCVSVEDGSFYCKKADTDVSINSADDGLYSFPDAGGDLEIYLKKNGELSQLTSNEVDDAAPYFDSISNTIVWHKQINERFQIVSLDLENMQEIQITADAENNMEPTRAGKYTVWQHWNQNNWDIVLYDGVEITYLSKSFEHDMAPKVRGSLVMWNKLTDSGHQTIELYDLLTKEFTTINDAEGGALSNPRMVLVYESAFENGDVVTKGYDVLTGEITPLSTKAADLPEDIPSPDDTGEHRALIQLKNGTKDDSETADIFPQDVGGGVSATSSTSTTLDMSTQPATSTLNVPTSSTTVMTLDLSTPEIPASTDTDFELTILPFVPAVAVATSTPVQ
jgi:hypothetical protein